VIRVTKTDNKSLADKVYLHERAIEHLTERNVLDLFAGGNNIWKSLDKNRYYGVELEQGKGANLCAAANVALKSLDLSQFNVIDCDSYAVPFEICLKLLNNEAVKNGTVIVYTAITSAFSQLPKACIDCFNIGDMFKVAPTLFNQNAINYFYDMLADNGVEKISYYESNDMLFKQYGYFIKP
jgi:hypothetical protein